MRLLLLLLLALLMRPHLTFSSCWGTVWIFWG
jgi:hypothetical protein